MYLNKHTQGQKSRKLLNKINTSRRHWEQTLHYHCGLLSRDIEFYLNGVRFKIMVLQSCKFRCFVQAAIKTLNHKYGALIRSYRAYQSVNEWDKDK